MKLRISPPVIAVAFAVGSAVPAFRRRIALAGSDNSTAAKQARVKALRQTAQAD